MKGSRTPVKPSACFPAWASAGKARDALRADHPNLQLPHTTIRFWSGFSDDQWLCCSLFGANAHFSGQNLLTFHVIYQQELGWRISFQKLMKFLNGYFFPTALSLYAGTPLDPKDIAPFERFTKATKAAGFLVRTKPLKKIWMDRKAKTFEYKCNFDVEIALDVAECVQRNLVDVVMIGSGDSDFLAIKSFAKQYNKQFVALCFEKGAAWEIRKGYHIFLEDLRPLIEHP